MAGPRDDYLSRVFSPETTASSSPNRWRRFVLCVESGGELRPVGDRKREVIAQIKLKAFADLQPLI